MLDLRTIKEKTYEVILFDGETLNIKRPSERMVIDMMGYEESLKNGSNAEKINTLATIIKEILNNNTNGKKFTMKYVQDNFTIDISMMFISEFMNFVNNINNDPN